MGRYTDANKSFKYEIVSVIVYQFGATCARQWDAESELLTTGWPSSWVQPRIDPSVRNNLRWYWGEMECVPPSGEVWLVTTDWLTYNWLADWLAGWLANWLVDLLAGWLAGWLADWLTDWLTDWLADWLTDSLPVTPTVTSFPSVFVFPSRRYRAALVSMFPVLADNCPVGPRCLPALWRPLVAFVRNRLVCGLPLILIRNQEPAPFVLTPSRRPTLLWHGMSRAESRQRSILESLKQAASPSSGG